MLAQLPLRELAVGEHAGEMILHLAQHGDCVPQPLAAGRIGFRPGLPGGDIIVLELLEGFLQQYSKMDATAIYEGTADSRSASTDVE